MAASFLAGGELVGSAARAGAAAYAITPTIPTLVTHCHQLNLGRVSPRYRPRLVACGSVRFRKLDAHHSINQKFRNAKPKAPAVLHEFQIARLLLLRREKLHASHARRPSQLQVHLARRGGDRLLVLDAAAAIIFVRWLFA